MRCTSPKKMSFDKHGNRTFSKKLAVEEIVPFDISCGKCISCQLEYSRSWAVRCVHEALITPIERTNLFITLTYSDEHLPGPILVKNDFDRFLERLKDNYGYRSVYACGEYGKETKRPHWHALLFDFTLPDLKKWSSNKHGNDLYTSLCLDDMWPYNDKKFPNKIGYVDYGSAAYVARYHNKSLAHGTKQQQKEQGLEPLSIKTKGLGKHFLEKYHSDIFNYGYVVMNGSKHSIPRYYNNWYQKHYPEQWLRYVTEVRLPLNKKVSQMSDEQYQKWINDPERSSYALTPLETKNEILKLKTASIMRNRGD